ncbi:Gaa1-like protein [Mucidula mucida]|nr:Gaa1-like protein [Mucidula mucida]
MDVLRGKIRALKQRLRPDGDVTVVRLQRRAKMTAMVQRRLPLLKFALFTIGYLWMLALPLLPTGTTEKMDENALLPGQVHTHWNWAEVHIADRYLEQLEALRDNNATSEQRSDYLVKEFAKLGLAASAQPYKFSTVLGTSDGINAYAILSSPRTSGSEAIVISASWLSRTGEGDGTLNLRGVSTILAFAAFVKRYSLWAKDLVFVISDGYLEGMQAWLSAYHGVSQSNVQAADLELTSGVIWTALNVDYPGHSFSHLGIYHEGLNGRLPNQDLLRAFRRISRGTGGVPVILYDHLDPKDAESSLGDLLPKWIPIPSNIIHLVEKYCYFGHNVLQHANYQARGIGSGTHALFHQYRIDAFTMYALPATGPHGFHSIGRVLESTLRTANNLLERLHASFFFYLLTNADYSLKIGNFLPSAILVSVAMMFGGLRLWTDAGWIRLSEEKGAARWVTRPRPVLQVLTIMTSTHLVGAAMFWTINTSWVANSAPGCMLVALCASALPLLALLAPLSREDEASVPSVLKSLNLCFASTIISAVAVLNFSLAASMGVALGIPLTLSASHKHIPKRLAHYTCYMILGTAWLCYHSGVTKMIWDWQVLGVWFCPFLCIIFSPLVMQAGIVCLLP